jgi:phage tail sheath protein FI
LFIALQQQIGQAAQALLFEQNDEYTRNTFVNLVEPYLRQVKGRRGISDFFVVCDATNNPGDAIDRGEFRGDIYVKPIRSVNFLQLNFTAVRSDVAFTEVVTNLQ